MSNELWHAKKNKTANKQEVQGPTIDYSRQMMVARASGDAKSYIKWGKRFCDALIADSGTKKNKATKSSKNAHPLSLTKTGGATYKKGDKTNLNEAKAKLVKAEKAYDKLSAKQKKRVNSNLVTKGSTALNVKKLKRLSTSKKK